MKIMVASDLHGSSYYVKKLIDCFKEEKASLLVLLGDILYHGPRNDLPLEYNPKLCVSMLNDIKDQIICVKGNCDSEVDEMVLDFPILKESSLVFGNKIIYFTHGHIHNPENPLNAPKGSVVFYGHFHIPKYSDVNGVLYVNPGSTSIPKLDDIRSYAIIDHQQITVKTLEKEVVLDISY